MLCRICQIDEPLYVYNLATPHSDHKVSLHAQKRVDELVRSMPPLNRSVPGSRLPGRRAPSCSILAPRHSAVYAASSQQGTSDVNLEWEVKGVWVPEEASVLVTVNGRDIFSGGAGGRAGLVVSELSVGAYWLRVEIVAARGGRHLASSEVGFTVE